MRADDVAEEPAGARPGLEHEQASVAAPGESAWRPTDPDLADEIDLYSRLVAEIGHRTLTTAELDALLDVHPADAADRPLSP